jgi:hypothetical protein
VNTYKAGEAVAELAGVSNPDLPASYDELNESRVLGGWAHAVIVPAWEHGDRAAIQLVATLISSDDPLRRHSGMSILSTRGGVSPRVYSQLQRQALASARDEDVNAVQLLLFSIARTSWSKAAILDLARSPAAELRWLALASTRLGRQPRGKPFPIYEPARQTGELVASLNSLTNHWPEQRSALERGLDGLLEDLSRVEPDGVLDWVKSRYAALAGADRGSADRYEVLTEREMAALAPLSNHSRLVRAVLSWFVAEFPQAGYRFVTETPGLVRAVLGSSWGQRARAEFTANPPPPDVARGLLRDAPFGPQWLELAAFLVLHGGSRAPAQVAGLAHPTSWTGSAAPILRQRAIALREAGTTAGPTVAAGFNEAARLLDDDAAGARGDAWDATGSEDGAESDSST